tara:strand:+ start:50 stop:151 length:102 start_codon:yes stop_codon:yes gene_type:complete
MFFHLVLINRELKPTKPGSGEPEFTHEANEMIE